MSDTKLLPCPFCGSDAITIETKGRDMFGQCDDCFASTQFAMSKREAIATWNTRTLTPEQAAAGELVALLDGLTLDGYGILDDPRGQRWHLSLPIKAEDINASIASKRASIAAALAKAGRS